MFLRMLKFEFFFRLRSFFDLLSNLTENKESLLVTEDGMR